MPNIFKIMLGFDALQLYIISRITQLLNKMKKKKVWI